MTTLRSWHQRYGIGPSQHVPGRHCRYTEADLARLQPGPRAVLVWSQLSGTGDPAQLAALTGIRPRPAVLAVAGPGWPADGLPQGVVCPASLHQALALLLSVAGGERVGVDQPDLVVPSHRRRQGAAPAR